MDAPAARRLIGTAINSFKELLIKDQQGANPNTVPDAKLVLAFLFDLTCNAEYLHDRLTNDRWIYCDAHVEGESRQHEAYFSFLKQCPDCCLSMGLDARIEKAQHKPTSHHIGEITSTITVLLLTLLAKATDENIQLAPIAKQSHDVDAVVFNEDLLVLLEVKSSPLVTFPVAAKLDGSLTKEGEDGPIEEARHALVNVDFRKYPLSLFIPHRQLHIPLPHVDEKDWPYVPLTDWISVPENFLVLFEAWKEIFEAYSVPKTQRTGSQISLGYIANGWGDEIDSNKTKPGLGRTDDVKKGTYQLIKYGAYYALQTPDLTIKSALVANLDPLFMHAAYLEKLLDIRWGKNVDFRDLPEFEEFAIKRDRLKWLYEGILTFNNPHINDETLRKLFNFDRLGESLRYGRLNTLIEEWMTIPVGGKN